MAAYRLSGWLYVELPVHAASASTSTFASTPALVQLDGSLAQQREPLDSRGAPEIRATLAWRLISSSARVVRINQAPIVHRAIYHVTYNAAAAITSSSYSSLR